MINLFSDTQTQPTGAMRRAIAAAEVGDEQRGEDPTVVALQERVAALLGHEAALFLPSGTMIHPLDGEDGTFTPETLAAGLYPASDRYAPRSRLVSVEQTTNMGGGRVWPLERVRGVLEVARANGLRAHLDGARLINAVVASGVDAATWAGGFDTAWVDFTKGLGAPVGACLAASRDLITEAWRYKQMWGGAMRQAGIIAAAGLYALDHHVQRLAEDHARARRLAEGLAELPGVGIDPATVETNIVIASVADPVAYCARLEAEGVLAGPTDARHVRFVTHLDIDDAGIDTALAAARRALA